MKKSGDESFLTFCDRYDKEIIQFKKANNYNRCHISRRDNCGCVVDDFFA